MTGIALVKRGGGISFADKINMATQFTWSYYDTELGTYITDSPVKAVIIYDEDPEATELIMMSADGTALTSAFISGKDGAALAEAAKAAIAGGAYVKLTVHKDDEVVSLPRRWQNVFLLLLGRGSQPGAEAGDYRPGGNIWSTILDGSYSPANPRRHV